MDKKLRNRGIRRISASSMLPVLIFMIVTTVGVILLSFIVNNAEYGSIWRNTTFIYAFVYIIIYPVLMPILYFVFYKSRGKSKNMRLRQTLAKPQRSAGWCVKWICISIGISQLANRIFIAIVGAIAAIFGVTPSENNLTAGDSILANVFLMISLIVFAPVFEEMLFRGILCRNNEELGQWFAVIISGVVFGLWHTNYSQLGLAVTFGITLGIMFVKTRSLIPTMITHFINNLLVGVVTICRPILMKVSGSEDAEYVLHYMYVKHLPTTILTFITAMLLVGITIAGIVLLIIEIVKRHKNHGMDKGRFEIGTLKKTLVYFSSPVTLITFAIMIFLTFRSIFSFRIG